MKDKAESISLLESFWIDAGLPDRTTVLQVSTWAFICQAPADLIGLHTKHGYSAFLTRSPTPVPDVER